jgi:hypothetical protein
VTFTLYSGAVGKGRPVSNFTPNTVSLVNGAANSASTGKLQPGSYYFIATYSGDDTYSAIAPGTAQPFTIIAVSPPKPPNPARATTKTKTKTKTAPSYRVATKPPMTGFGGSARTVYNTGVLVGGSAALLAGLLMLVQALRRRRRL